MSWAGIPEAAPMGPFLKRSVGVHAVVLAAAVFAAGRGGTPPQQVYRIDFIGGSAAILNRAEAGAAAAPAPAPAVAKPEARKDPDSFNLKPSFRPLPKPSFLDAARPDLLKKSPAPSQPSFAPAPSAAAASGGGTGGGEGPGTASVSADMPDFPYPWYLTSLRQNLWNRWSEGMPPGPAECQVTFSILRDGSIVDVRVSQTSGDRGFDYAAMSAARSSGPLPPLPPLFKERFLTVHVQFKAN